MSNTINDIRKITEHLDLGPTGSLQFQFAKLQLAMAEICKNGAMDYIKQIQDSQDEQKKISEMMQTLRQNQATAKADKKAVGVPDEIIKYMQDNGLALPKNKLEDSPKLDALMTRLNAATPDGEYIALTDEEQKLLRDNGISTHSMFPGLITKSDLPGLQTRVDTAKVDMLSFKHEDYDVMIQSMQARMDRVGSDTQQLMVFVQDFMGQYNSYLQGSNSVIQQGNQTLAELAKAR